MPSPSASQMTKYSNTSVNESTGRVITSVPLYSYNAGKLSIPLSLNYIGNGVKIDQHSNWVGTNWLLNAGGIVTRVVNHRPDELATTRLFEEDLQSIIDDPFYASELQNGINTTDDLRPDVFSYSFPGFSGSFYLDKTGMPRLMNDDAELKIELIESPTVTGFLNTIVITSPNGIKYFFGGDNASESSSTMIEKKDKGFETEPYQFDIQQKAITAFYLYQIKHPFGDQIDIEYHDDGDKDYLMFVGQRYSRIVSSGDDSACLKQLNLNLTNSFGNNGIESNFYKGKIYNRKKISKISSPNSDYEVVFNSTYITKDTNIADDNSIYFNPIYDPTSIFYTPQFDDRLLNSITVKNNLLSVNVKNVFLDYLETDSRFFLEKVKVNNLEDVAVEAFCSVYSFEYDEPEQLPLRFSRSQDLLGYYNNQNNSSLLPYTGNFEFNGVFSDLADRGVNFDAAKTGSLIRVIYPSGGNTEYEYESPKVNAEVTKRVFLNTYRNKPNRIPETLAIDTEPLGTPLVLPGDAFVGVSGNQTVDVKISVVVDQTTGNVNQSDKIYIDLFDAQTQTTETKFIALKDGVYDFNRTLSFSLIDDHAYTFKMRLSPEDPFPNQAAFTASAFMDVNINDLFDAYGIRIKNVINKTDDVTTASSKRYYYTRASEVYKGVEDEESAVITYDPSKQSEESSTYYNSTQSCCPNISLNQNTFSLLTLQSNPFAYFTAGADNMVEYKYVTVSFGGELFPEGGIEHQYKVEKATGPYLLYLKYPLAYDPTEAQENYYFENVLDTGGLEDNNTFLNGTLLKETVLKTEAAQLFKVKETDYTYNLVIKDTTEAMAVTDNTNDCVGANLFSYYSVVKYNNYSYDFDMVKSVTRDYFNDLPPVTSDNPDLVEEITDDFYDYLESEQHIEYNSDLQGMPSKVTTFNSDGEVNITENKYLTATDINSITDLTTADVTAYNNLIAEHRLTTTVESKSYFAKGSSIPKLRARILNTYKTFDNGLTLMEHSKIAKLNNPLEIRSTIHKYDADGDVLEMSSDGNVRTLAVYGYKDTKVIAQIINADYTNIPTGILNNLEVLSQSVVDQASQDALELELDNLRASLPEVQMNTYVYNKLGQLVTQKDVRGYKMSYTYDECYRLIYIKDQDGNILEHYEYNILNN